MASTGPPQSLKRPDSSLTREGDQLIITPLGAGNEFDCGIHPAYSGMAALPYFDEIDPSTIDVLLVTQYVLFPSVLEGSLYRKAVGHYSKWIMFILISEQWLIVVFFFLAICSTFSSETAPVLLDVLSTLLHCNVLHFLCSFHLDHAASLPYFLEKTTFKGRVFMTHATKAIYKLLLSDYVKVSKVSVEDMLYDEQDILRSMDKIEVCLFLFIDPKLLVPLRLGSSGKGMGRVIDFHQTLEVNGIRFWCYTAGHVLGAAMFMVDIAGVRVLYTGDYSREEDRHLRAAEIPQFSPDICIIESTYGVQLHQPRHVREKRFTDVIHSTISQGGRVLIPAFALGRAQELLPYP
ncbi:Cleavage and polyadenylation specificity factor subunit 3-I [Vitis vinifera]|uniref:Cleavage and polyadenylation specificity factor subunit 3-I n=1 Tax=Vitis vinifera TaxID=29760 RepID=A0A438J6Z6_VITVI|nr:Cleavage and polyadenylation specificity factor subunit 3-I [Vitis vinifera]